MNQSASSRIISLSDAICTVLSHARLSSQVCRLGCWPFWKPLVEQSGTQSTWTEKVGYFRRGSEMGSRVRRIIPRMGRFTAKWRDGDSGVIGRKHFLGPFSECPTIREVSFQPEGNRDLDDNFVGSPGEMRAGCLAPAGLLTQRRECNLIRGAEEFLRPQIAHAKP